MGEIYSLSDQELAMYRKIVLEQLNKYKKTKSVDNLTLFLIWLYEFVEMFAVNRQNKQGKLKTAKDFFDIGVVIKLFHARGELVHKRYGVSNAKIIDFYNENETDIDNLMKAAGFITTTSGTQAAMHSF